MAKRGLLIGAVGLLAVVGMATLLVIMPHGLKAGDVAAPHQPDLANGETLFTAGNCFGCHKTPGQDDRQLLGGGLRLTSPFGAFIVPNISPDPQYGIGAWTELEFVNAMKRGVGKRGEHLYPSLPYLAYSEMPTSDVRDVFAYIKTLPAVAHPTTPHELKFPYNIRLSVGVWKALYFRPHDFQPDATKSAEWNRGAYLANGVAHCSECHTPRNALAAPELKKFYGGAPNLEVGGRFVNNITPHPDGIEDWTQEELASFLQTGMDKCYNEPAGMANVLASTTRLSEADNNAMATYLKSLPPVAGAGEHKTC